MQNKDSPDFRSPEVSISEMTEYWPHSFFTFLVFSSCSDHKYAKKNLAIIQPF